MARKAKFSVADEFAKLNRGKRISKAARKKLDELFGNEVGGQQPGTWPMRSLSLAVHPKDAAEANKLLKKAGVNAYHDRTGKLVIPDAATRKEVLKYRSRPGMQMVDFS